MAWHILSSLSGSTYDDILILKFSRLSFSVYVFSINGISITFIMSSNSCTENRKLKHFSLQLHLLLISRSPQHPKAKSNESEIPNSWAPGRDSHRTSGNASAFFSRMVCGATGRQHHVWNLGYDWLISERRPIRCCVTWFDVFYIAPSDWSSCLPIHQS